LVPLIRNFSELFLPHRNQILDHTGFTGPAGLPRLASLWVYASPLDLIPRSPFAYDLYRLEFV
jgi:hypothetical protein